MLLNKWNIKGTRRETAWLVFFSLLGLFLIYENSRGRNDNRPIKRSELTSIQGTLSFPVRFVVSKSGKSISFKLKEFDDFKFVVSGVRLGAVSVRDFIESVKPGDSVVLAILTYDYETKIKKLKNLRASERILNYPFISPYEIRSNGSVFMTLEQVNDEWELEDSLGMFMVIFVGAMVGLYAIFEFTGSIDRFRFWFEKIRSNR